MTKKVKENESFQMSIFDEDLLEIIEKEAESEVSTTIVNTTITVQPQLREYDRLLQDLKDNKVFVICVESIFLGYNEDGKVVYGNKAYEPKAYGIYSKKRRSYRSKEKVYDNIRDCYKAAYSRLKNSVSLKNIQACGIYSNRTPEEIAKAPMLSENLHSISIFNLEKSGLEVVNSPMSKRYGSLSGESLTGDEIKELIEHNSIPQAWRVKSKSTNALFEESKKIIPYANEFSYESQGNAEKKMEALQYVLKGFEFINQHITDTTHMPNLTLIRVKNKRDNTNANYTYNYSWSGSEVRCITLRSHSLDSFFHEYYHYLEHTALLMPFNVEQFNVILEVLEEQGLLELKDKLLSLDYAKNISATYIKDLTSKIHNKLLESKKVKSVMEMSSKDYVEYYTSESEVLARAFSSYAHYYRVKNNLDDTFVRNTLMRNLYKEQIEDKEFVQNWLESEKGKEALERNLHYLLDYQVEEIEECMDDIYNLIQAIIIINEVHRTADKALFHEKMSELRALQVVANK